MPPVSASSGNCWVNKLWKRNLVIRPTAPAVSRSCPQGPGPLCRRTDGHFPLPPRGRGGEDFFFPSVECAFLPIEGQATFIWNGQMASGRRAALITEPKSVPHVPRNTVMTLRASVRGLHGERTGFPRPVVRHGRHPKCHLLRGHLWWCGYPLISIPQPEVCYCRIDHQEGFGFCCLGDNVYKIKDRSFSLLPMGPCPR